METQPDLADTKTANAEINLNPARDALRALLAATQKTARAYPGTLTSLACPGLCTGFMWMPSTLR